MKKNYITPKTEIINIAAAKMVCGSGNSVTISNTTTSTQWSRGGGNWDDEENEDY